MIEQVAKVAYSRLGKARRGSPNVVLVYVFDFFDATDLGGRGGTRRRGLGRQGRRRRRRRRQSVRRRCCGCGCGCRRCRRSGRRRRRSGRGTSLLRLVPLLKRLSELEASTGAHKVTNAKQQAPPRRCGGTQTHSPIVVRPPSRQEALFPRCPGRRNGRALRHVDDSSPPRHQPGRFIDVIL